MVSFSCENCGDVLTKKKLDSHRNQCRGAYFSCIDCMRTFSGTEYRSHTSCISESQKYQGSLYKEKKKPQKEPFQEDSQHANETSQMTTENPLFQNALVKMSTILQETRESSLAIVDAPPRAPSPPPMLQTINVFDFLVKDDDDEWEDEDDMHVDRPNYNPHHAAYQTNGYAYGAGPIPAGATRMNSYNGKPGQQNGNAFETPAPRKSRGKNVTSDSSTAKKSSKRKFAHVDDLDLSKSGPDVIMTDATPSGIMHSGLTGGIHKLLSKTFPPSPDPSGDGNSPTSPVKRSRKERSDKDARREKKARRKSDSDKEKMEGSKRKKHKTEATAASKSKEGKKVHRHERRVGRRRSASPGITKQHALSLSPPERPRKMKAIEYHPSSDAQEEDMSKALVKVEHAPTTKSVDTFLSCLVKGSETDQGVSVWKALKRWRKQGGSGDQEKELWKELKIRSNERGELVICI